MRELTYVECPVCGGEGQVPAMQPHDTQSINAPSIDWLGLALELEKQAKRVDSQTVERAMLAGARGLRLMGGEK